MTGVHFAAAAHAALAPPSNAHLTTFEKYTAAAYLVVFVGVLAYVLIIASKLQRLQRQVGEVLEKLRERKAAGADSG
jgi:CcmD family protein